MEPTRSRFWDIKSEINYSQVAPFCQFFFYFSSSYPYRFGLQPTSNTGLTHHTSSADEPSYAPPHASSTGKHDHVSPLLVPRSCYTKPSLRACASASAMEPHALALAEHSPLCRHLLANRALARFRN